MKKLDIANKITKSAIDHFGNKLVSILLYGSSLSARRLPNDLDIIIILRDRETPEDLSFHFGNKLVPEFNIDLQIINLPDISPDSFSHDTHGQFVISFLHHAHPIYGKNPFLNFFPKYTQCVISVIQKARYYYFRAKKLQANDIHPGNKQNFSFHRKKLILMLSDFWLVYSGKVDTLTEPECLNHVISILTQKNPYSGEVNFLLNNSTSFDWGNIFSLYQKYYFAILDMLRPAPKITASFVGDIYLESNDIDSDKLAVIASGCPSDYDEKEMTHFLNIRGYNVINFHYTATGKSKGMKFRLPQNDITDVINNVKKDYKQIFVISNSYGGYATLALNRNTLSKIDKIIAVSPVIDFQQVQNIETLPKYLATHQPGWYRFKEQEFTDFIQNFPKIDSVNLDNVTILHGEFDEQIKADNVKNFCQTSKVDLKLLKSKHLSLNRLTRENLDTLDNLL